MDIEASVIIPIYNTEKYIERAVRSVLNQTYTNFEVILVDDGSTDDSWKVCVRLATISTRIKIFHQNNLGVASARNLGIKKAQGKYLFFLDSDDEWKNNLLKEIINCFTKTDCDCVRFQAISTDNNSFFYSIPVEKECVFNQHEFLVKAMSDKDYFINISSACWGAYKNSIIKKNQMRFSVELAQGEDGLFVMDYLLSSEKIVCLNEQMYIYYIYNPKERLSTTGRGKKILFDEYELRLLLYNKLYLRYRYIFTYNERKCVYTFFYDRMIAMLIRFIAYSKHLKWRNKIYRIKKLLDNDLMKESALYYVRLRKSDSKLIPYFMRNRWIIPLYLVLCIKTKEYYRIYGKEKYAVSIYKK